MVLLWASGSTRGTASTEVRCAPTIFITRLERHHPNKAGPTEGGVVIVLRQVIGDELRRRRQDQGRTLRDVSGAAAVSLGYLSEVERGQKEASSELLAAICGALEVSLSDVLASVSTHVAEAEVETIETRTPSLSSV
jgi:predicted transcriptional regulator